MMMAALHRCCDAIMQRREPWLNTDKNRDKWTKINFGVTVNLVGIDDLMDISI